MQRFVAVAALTCLEDLQVHAGLMQLLHLPGLRAELVLTLPTKDAVAIVRAEARRDAWLGLATLIAEADWPALQASLQHNQPIVLFRGPSVLTGSEFATARAWLEARGAGDPFALGPILFRRADADMGGEEQPLAPSALQKLLAIESDVLADPRMNDQPSDGKSQKARLAEVWHIGGKVDLPPLREEDEMIVAVDPDHGASQAIARLWGGLHSGPRQVRFSPTAALLATRPQPIRMKVLRGEGGAVQTDLSFHLPPEQLEPWMLSAFLNRGGAGNPVMQAFAEGTGCRLSFAEDEPEILRDVPVVWGVLRQSDRILDQARRQSLYFFYVDHAYFDRGHGHSYRIARNAYEAGPVRVCPPDRLNALGLDIRPWRKGGREIIVCPPTEYFMKAHGCADWLESTLAGLSAVTDRPVVVRVKPRPGEAATSLPEALETAHALVTHSSNVAVETACLGTPVFVSPASAAAPVGRTDIAQIEAPVYPDRTAWLAHLAYNQYSFEEIGDGRAWGMIRELECRELA